MSEQAPAPVIYGPSTNIHAPRDVVAFRTDADDDHLRNLVGRIVHKYFPGYGNFLGKVMRKVPERPVVDIDYEDGDGEELYLDQVLDALMPLDTLPVDDNRNHQDTNDKYGYVWPPPTTSTRLLVTTARKRQPSAYAQMQEAIKLQKQREAEEYEAQKIKNREERERKRKEKEAAEKERLLRKQAIAEAKAREKARREKEKRESERKKKEQAKLKAKAAAAAAAKAKAVAAKAKAAAAAESKAKAVLERNVSTKAKAISTKEVKGKETVSGGSIHSNANQGKKSLAGKRSAISSPTGSPLKKRNTKSREWIKCETCPAKHWSDTCCKLCHPEASPKSANRTSKRWTGNSTAELLMALKKQVHEEDPDVKSGNGKAPVEDPVGILLAVAQSTSADTKARPSAEAGPAQVGNEEECVSEIYNIIKGKMDITSGADGYGMTGNVTRASMQKLFNVLRERFELDESSWFIDLGHGMGRPTMHAAALQPPIAGSFGTEFNPQLYKQSMLALVECTESIPSLKDPARVFFMDQNIKDMTSLEPFSHVYTFQIGMPEDVVHHMLDLIKKSRSVKYVILYPHRAVSVKRLKEVGDVVHSISMTMPGGCSYEVNIVKVRHNETLSATPVDSGVKNAMELLGDKRLYDKYLSQLGIVRMLEHEQVQMMHTRGSRRNVSNSMFLSQSPCIPDINYGFLRRIAVALGVSTAGGKVQILSNIQLYCPVTFGLSMFAVGDNYTEEYLQFVVDKLLAVPPSQRQPEAMHN